MIHFYIFNGNKKREKTNGKIEKNKQILKNDFNYFPEIIGRSNWRMWIKFYGILIKPVDDVVRSLIKPYSNLDHESLQIKQTSHFKTVNSSTSGSALCFALLFFSSTFVFKYIHLSLKYTYRNIGTLFMFFDGWIHTCV